MENKINTLFDYIKTLSESDLDRIIKFVLGRMSDITIEKIILKNLVLVKKSVGNFLNQQQLPITDIFYAVPIAFLSDCAQG